MRRLRGIVSVAILLGMAAGCYGPDSYRVPPRRAIGASLMSANSLEAETVRNRRRGWAEGWPIPSKPVVSALGPADAGIAPPSRPTAE